MDRSGLKRARPGPAGLLAILLGSFGVCLRAAATAAQAEPVPGPTIDAVLAPEFGAQGDPTMGVTLRLSAPGLASGQALLRMPVTLVGTPTAAYPAAAIAASDEAGPLTLTASEEAPTSSGTYRNYLVGRATSGAVTVRYRTTPRQVGPETRNGPLFDWRREGDGMMGAGVYFFAAPPGSASYRIRLAWNLPAGMRGVSSRGEGEQQWEGTGESLAFAFYAAGPVQSIPADGRGDFVFYWLRPPPFDPAALGAGTERLYHSMAAFFGESGLSYRVFARSNPYPSGGGTALARSFMFGYGNGGQTNANGTDMLVAHEMAHTWPAMAGDHPLTAWYSEGAAEYYSVLLSLRAGTIDHARFLSLINRKAEGYYTGVYRGLNNAEAGKLFWKDPRAQRVPYERGFLYLVRLDGQIRARSRGRRSVDNLVLDVLGRQRKGQQVGVPEWRALVVAELGQSAGREFDAMVAGKLIPPPRQAFAPCYRLVPATLTRFDLGFSDSRPDVVKDLRANTAAERAGLREGDVIVTMTPLAEVRENPSAEVAMEIRRGDQTLAVRFLPRSDPAAGWQWQRVPGVPDSACKL